MKKDDWARKTSSSLTTSLMLAVLVASEIWLFASCTTRVGQTTACQTEKHQVSNVGSHYLITEVQ